MKEVHPAVVGSVTEGERLLLRVVAVKSSSTTFVFSSPSLPTLVVSVVDFDGYSCLTLLAGKISRTCSVKLVCNT
jgi:hypothetical protein